MFNENEDGSVTVCGFNFNETMRPWGHPDGFGVSGCVREAYNGEARPVFLVHACRWYVAPNRSQYTPGLLPPVDRIVRSIPREVLQAVYRFIHWPIELIQLAETNVEAFLLLAKSNPALLSLIAKTAAQHPLWETRHWGEQLLGLDEKEITKQLGYGGAFARFLRKIPDTGLCTNGYLELAIGAWRRPKMPRLLMHVKTVNLDLITTALNHSAIAANCPSVLHLAAKDEYTVFSTLICETLESIVQIRRALGKPPWPWRKIASFDQLNEYKLRTEAEVLAQGKLADVVYPEPPISSSSDWMWISCLSQLQHLGQQFKNCAESFHWRCISGQSVIYVSVLTAYEDTVIVLLNRFPTGSWEVADIVGPCNAQIAEAEADIVRKFFQDALKQEGSDNQDA